MATSNQGDLGRPQGEANTGASDQAGAKSAVFVQNTKYRLLFLQALCMA